MRHFDVAVAVIFRQSKILIARRKADAVLGGFWEFPGGKIEPGETPERCVRREVIEELAMNVRPVVSFASIQHQYPDRLITLYPFLCTHESGEPKLLACDEIRWVEPLSLRDFAFPPANQQLIDMVIAAFPASLPSGPSLAISRRRTSARQRAAV